MSELIYIDSNVYLDYLLNRKDRLRPLSDFAFELLKKAVSCEYWILMSDTVLDEISAYTSKEDIEKLIGMIQKKLKLVPREENDFIRAKQISPSNKIDALHYVLAKKGGAKIIVTRNIQHFDFSDLQIKFPENL